MACHAQTYEICMQVFSTEFNDIYSVLDMCIVGKYLTHKILTSIVNLQLVKKKIKTTKQNNESVILLYGGSKSGDHKYCHS